jgi:hypothetical protein
MAITKSSQTYMEKEAFSPMHALIAPILHVVQNVIAKKNFSNVNTQKQLAKVFSSGSKSGNAGFGALGTTIPEISILERHIKHVGGTLNKAMAEEGIQLSNLSASELKLLQDLMKGEFSAVAKTMNVPNKEKIINSFSKVLPKQDAEVVKDIIEHGDAGVKELERVWKENPLSGKLLSGIGDKLETVLSNNSKVPIDDIMRRGKIEGTTLGAIAAIDPATALMNITKEVMDSKRLGNMGVKFTTKHRVRKRPGSLPETKIREHHIKPIGYVQDKVRKHFVTDPVRKSFNMGLQGKKENYTGFKNKLTEYGMNPVIHHGRKLSQGIGYAASRANISPDRIQSLRTSLFKKSQL